MSPTFSWLLFCLFQDCVWSVNLAFCFSVSIWTSLALFWPKLKEPISTPLKISIYGYLMSEPNVTFSIGPGSTALLPTFALIFPVPSSLPLLSRHQTIVAELAALISDLEISSLVITFLPDSLSIATAFF